LTGYELLQDGQSIQFARRNGTAVRVMVGVSLG